MKKENKKTDNQSSIDQENVRPIYVVADTCFISNIAGADNPIKGIPTNIYRSDVERLLSKVNEHNANSNQVTATFMLPTPLLGEIFSNESTVDELFYFMNGQAYTPSEAKKQIDPIRLTGDKNSTVFNVGIRTKNLHFFSLLMKKVKDSVSCLDKGIDSFRLLVKHIMNSFLNKSLYSIDLNEKNVFALERQKGGKKHHYIDYQTLLCIQTIKNEHGEPIVLTDDKNFFMKCRDINVLSLSTQKRVNDDNQLVAAKPNWDKNYDSSSHMAELKGEIKSIGSFLRLFGESDAEFLPIVQENASINLRLNAPKGKQKNEQAVSQETSDSQKSINGFEDYFSFMNTGMCEAENYFSSNRKSDNKQIIIPVPLLLATTKENWFLFRKKMENNGYNLTVMPYSTKEAIATGYLSQLLKEKNIFYNDVSDDESKYYLQILATIIMNPNADSGDGGGGKWFVPKEIIKYSKILGIDLSKYNLIYVSNKKKIRQAVIKNPSQYRYTDPRGRE